MGRLDSISMADNITPSSSLHRGVRRVYAHSSAHGHMTELYAPTPALIGFYGHVAKAARNFTGGDVIRPISL